MDYDTNLWNQYTDDNERTQQEELSKFIYYSTLCLGATRVCEAGCNIGNNLSAFPKDFEIYGIDINEYALKKARERFPYFNFQKENLSKISYPDSFFDLVFTRGVLVHLANNELDNVLSELLRISKKWVFNLEYFGNDGENISWKRGDNLLWYRNMKERWKIYDIELITDIDVPTDIDKGKTRITVIRKKV